MTMLATIELDDDQISALAAGDSVTAQAEPASLDGDQMTRYVVTIGDGSDMQRIPVTLQRYDLSPSDPGGFTIRLDAQRVEFLGGPRGGAKGITLFRDGQDSGYTAWVLGPKWNAR